MATAKLLNLIAVSTLAIIVCSLGTSPVTALSVDTTHLAARGHSHAALAVRKRRSNLARRCKPRPSSSSASSSAHPVTTAKPPTVTTSKAPAPATTTKASSNGSNSGANSGSNGGTGKVGLGWAVDDNTALAHFKTNEVGPIYNWSPYIDPAWIGLGFEPVPMLWGEKQIDQFKQLVVKGYARTVLGFNEPNQQGQSDMSPQRAASLWLQYIQPLKDQGYSLISPACTNAPSGKTWMQDFIKACDGCHLDGIAVHFYGTDPNAMISYLEDMHSTFNLPIWPTEFACQNFGGGAQCNEGQVWNFMQTVKGFMDSTSWVAHYFAFGALYNMDGVNPLNQLLAPDGHPTALGSFYIGN